jgi:hypothetical protein
MVGSVVASIIIYLLIGYIFWLISYKYYKEIGFNQLFIFLPFLSPHIGWFLANVMTEGPLMLCLLGMIYLTYLGRFNSLPIEFMVMFILLNCALISKQSWPIVSIVLAAYLVNRIPNFKKITLYIIALLITYTFAIIIKNWKLHLW